MPKKVALIASVVVLAAVVMACNSIAEHTKAARSAGIAEAQPTEPSNPR